MRHPETGPVTYPFEDVLPIGTGPARDDDQPRSHAAMRAIVGAEGGRIQPGGFRWRLRTQCSSSQQR